MEELSCFSSIKCEFPGADLLKYYHRPVESTFPCRDVISETEEQKEEVDFSIWESHVITRSEKVDIVHKSTQTDYRESEAQTDPWDPPIKVIKYYKEPNVLSLKKFSYGKGLPASMLEVDYIIEAFKNKNMIDELENVKDEGSFKKKKEIISDQVKSNWNYKIAVENQSQLKKLKQMKLSIIEELNKKSVKRELILRNMWNRKKGEINKQNVKLEEKLNKEIKAVENNFLSEENITANLNMFKLGTQTTTNRNKGKLSSGNMDYLLNNYILSNPEGLTTVKNWLEEKQTVLRNQVPLPKLNRINQREHLAEEAYQSIIKKRTKLPPKVYHEDYEREETPLPAVKPEDMTEYLVLEENKVDMVTVWQQILRGLAYQKQMLQLIEKHKDGLSISLSNGIS